MTFAVAPAAVICNTSLPSVVKSKFAENDIVLDFFSGSATTANAVLKNNLRLDVNAPMPNAPSMAAAIELFVKDQMKKK